jgi:hypothetical protein
MRVKREEPRNANEQSFKRIYDESESRRCTSDKRLALLLACEVAEDIDYSCLAETSPHSLMVRRDFGSDLIGRRLS